MSYLERIFSGRPKSDQEPVEKHPSITLEGSSSYGGGSEAARVEARDTEQHLCCGFDTILDQLKADPEDLHARIERLKSLPDQDGILKKLESYFGNEQWELLAVLEAYDQKTFDHSVRVASYVYAIADEKSETGTYLRSQTTFEHGSLGELFTAALLHDIGKTIIPRTILHDDHSRREWAKRANEWAEKQGAAPHFDPEKIAALDDIELDRYFMETHHERGADPLDIVPINEIFDRETVQELAKNGISPDSTFREVLEYHERATKAILRRGGLYIASDIASHHHDYDGSPIRLERYPTEISALRISFELSILRSMDVYDALTSNDREYLKKPRHPLIALEILIKDAEAEFTEPELTRRVVQDLYRHVEAAGKHIPGTKAESSALEKVLAFIGKSA